MRPPGLMTPDMAEAVDELHARQQPFALAVIVRTAGATAAKPGAKALIGADGTILRGWLGGGCTRGAVKRAAMQAIAEGTPQLVSVAPEELLSQMGVQAGEEVAGTKFARNGCPSRGTVDIFIEPCLPAPQLVILGTSPVAQALASLAPQFQWSVTSATSEGPAAGRTRCIVVATQGQGDLDALKSALTAEADYRAFVGSARKFATLADRLAGAGFARETINGVRAPAGLDLGAVTPEEIALSILAELVQVRRQRGEARDG